MRVLKDKEKKEFLWDLYYLLEGKIPIAEAMEIIKGHKKSHKSFYDSALSYLKEGFGLSQSLKKAGFTDRYILKVIEVAEQGNFLEEALFDLCNLMDEKEKLKSKITKSLIYPSILLIFAIITIFFTFSYVLPSVLDIYAVLGIEKSLPLKIMLKYNPGTILLFALAIIILHYYINYRKGKLEKLLLIGPIYSSLERFLFYKMLGNLLKGGVPLYQSVEVVRELPKHFSAATLDDVLQRLFSGLPLNVAIEESGFDIALSVNFIRVAEESGDIIIGIRRVEKFYKRNVENDLAYFGKVFEPIIIAIVGITVVIVVLTLLLPIYQLFQNM